MKGKLLKTNKILKSILLLSGILLFIGVLSVVALRMSFSFLVERFSEPGRLDVKYLAGIENTSRSQFKKRVYKAQDSPGIYIKIFSDIELPSNLESKDIIVQLLQAKVSDTRYNFRLEIGTDNGWMYDAAVVEFDVPANLFYAPKLDSLNNRIVHFIDGARSEHEEPMEAKVKSLGKSQITELIFKFKIPKIAAGQKYGFVLLPYFSVDMVDAGSTAVPNMIGRIDDFFNTAVSGSVYRSNHTNYDIASDGKNKISLAATFWVKGNASNVLARLERVSYKDTLYTYELTITGDVTDAAGNVRSVSFRESDTFGFNQPVELVNQKNFLHINREKTDISNKSEKSILFEFGDIVGEGITVLSAYAIFDVRRIESNR